MPPDPPRRQGLTRCWKRQKEPKPPWYRKPCSTHPKTEALHSEPKAQDFEFFRNLNVLKPWKQKSHAFLKSTLVGSWFPAAPGDFSTCSCRGPTSGRLERGLPSFIMGETAGFISALLPSMTRSCVRCSSIVPRGLGEALSLREALSPGNRIQLGWT